MSPRIAAMARLVILVLIATLLPQAAYAQTCTPPTIAQIGGMNPSCAGAPVTLDPGDGWVAYEWSNGATTRSITDTPLASTAYTVTTTDALGCQVTSSPFEILVNASLAPPEIDLYEPEICPSSTWGGYAMVAPPPAGTEYTAYEWSIINGSFPYASTDSTVSFQASGEGSVELGLTVTDQNGCQASTSVSVPLRTLAEPQIELYEPEICPNSTWAGYATLAPAPPGVNYQSYEWSIINGSFPYGNTSSSVSFTADGAGPVELSVRVREERGCEATSTVTVPLRSIPPPQIELYEPEICPNSTWAGYATLAAPPAGITYQSYEWSIINGSFPYGNTSASVSFTANGAGPVELSVRVTEDRGCQSTNSITVPLRSIPPPQIELYEPEICPNSTWGGYAMVATPPPGISYQSYEWSIVNGSFPYGNTSSSVSFTANGAGPVELSVRVTEDRGCQSTNSVTVPLRSIPPPEIQLYHPGVCPGGSNVATAAPPPPGISYQTWEWSIVNGTLPYGNTYSSVMFIADGNGPVELTLTVTESRGCRSTKTITVPLGSGAPPPISLMNPTFCSTETNYATVNGIYSWYDWSVVNGTILSGQGTNQIELEGNGRDAITISVTASDGQGCTVSNSVVIPMGAAPVEIIAPATACAGSLQKAKAPSITPYSDFEWTVTNAVIEGPANQGELLFRADGSGPVTISLSALNISGCRSASSVEIPLGPMPVPEIQVSYDTICPLGYSSAYVYGDADVYASYEWIVTNVSYLSGQGTPAIQFDHQPGFGDVTIELRVGEGSCAATATRVIPVRAAVEPVMELVNPTVCENGTGTIYFDNYDSFSYVSFFVTNGFISSQSSGRVPGGRTITFRSTGGGDVTVLMMADSNSCNQQKTFTIPVTPNPVAGIHSTQIYDDGGSGTVTRQGDNIEACGNPTVRLVPMALNASYSYSWSNGATTAVLDVTTSGTYTLTVTTPSGCSTTSSVNVHYGAFPPKPTIAAPATELCPAGGSVTLTAPNADAWTWSNGATTQSIVVTEPGPYTVRVRNGACDSQPSDPVIVTTGLSTISTNDSLALCGPGSSATLTADGGTSWLWSNGATTQSIVVTQTGTYSVITTNNGCTMPESAPVTVTSRSVSIDANGPTTFCGGGTNVTLTASGGTSWLWSNGATTQSITLYQSGNYGVTATFADGCVIAATPVTVDARQVTVSVTADRTTVCENGSIELSASASGSTSYTYQWYDNTYTPILGATSSTLTITPVTSGFVYVKVLDELGCEATSGGTSYTVLPSPDATITTAAAICEGQTGSASVSDAGPNATYSWTITNGSLFFPNASSVTFTANSLEPVTLTVTVSNPGCAVTSSKSVAVNALPAATITPSGPTTFCTGGSVTLTASAGASYLWSNGATTQSINVTAPDNYTVTVTNAAGCSTMSAPTSVVVNTYPDTPNITASGPTTFCAGGSVTLSAPAGFTYQWSNGATTQSIVVNATNNYTVTVTNASGCSTISAPKSVTVNAATTISQHPQNKTIPKNTSATLTVTASGTGTLTYQWYKGTSPSTATPISGATASSYTTPKLTKGTYTYWVRVTGTCGVANSSTATVTAQ